MISALQAELTNLDSIHTSYRLLILAATQLLKNEPSLDGPSTSNSCARRSILPFLGDALNWLKEHQFSNVLSSLYLRKTCNKSSSCQQMNQDSYYITSDIQPQL